MKSGQKRKSSCGKELFETKGKFKFEASYKEYREVMKRLNTLVCQTILNNEEGYSLPYNLGRLIILGTKPRVKNVYSMTQPGTRITNIHSFGWIYRVFHKERILIRYPELYKFRPHRENLKVPINVAIVKEGKSYIKQSDLKIQ